jgi:hypothetical protein
MPNSKLRMPVTDEKILIVEDNDELRE